MAIGIDVAADRFHCVALETNGSFVGGRVYAPDDVPMLSEWAADADVIAIDAPAQLSTAPHSADESLSPKFRAARCSEIALGREHRIWVPWTSPTSAPIPEWIATGLELYPALARSVRAELMEVFPYAGFRVLTRPAHLAKKRSGAGIRQRIETLRAVGLRAADLELWSHDSVDAALAAIIALRRQNDSAVPVTCGHDGSVIWLPQLELNP